MSTNLITESGRGIGIVANNQQGGRYIANKQGGLDNTINRIRDNKLLHCNRFKVHVNLMLILITVGLLS